MDVLNCEICEVNGRRYRRNVPLMIERNPNLKGAFDLPDLEEDEYDSDCDYEKAPDTVDEEADAIKDEINGQANGSPDVEVEPVVEAKVDHYSVQYDSKKRAYHTEIMVPNELLGILIGFKGTNKKKIEDTTGAKIIIPKRDETGPVVVSSPDKEAVERCYDNIEMIIISNRKKVNFTHFVFVPVDDPKIMEEHEKLIEKIRSSSKVDESCKDPVLFNASNRLHLTIAPLWLFSASDIEKAKNALSAAVSEFKKQNKGPVEIAVKGLSHFGDEDLDHVRVIYGKVESKKLQQLANLITKAMVKSGQGETPRGDAVKLHMTVLKTRNLPTEEKAERKYIDATGLLKEFGNFDYGKTFVDKIQISEMSSFDVNTVAYHSNFQKFRVFCASKCSTCNSEGTFERHYTDIGLTLCLGLCGILCIGPCLAFILRKKRCSVCYKNEFLKNAPTLREHQCFVNDRSSIPPPLSIIIENIKAEQPVKV
uniref:K Homology domain-containing protein n=1 Tax=Panagrolaimus sp. JU765 TaxID=591449 RepID=A0AC34RAJ4_9BILA